MTSLFPRAEAAYNNFRDQLDYVGRPGEAVILQKAVHLVTRLRVIQAFEFATGAHRRE